MSVILHSIADDDELSVTQDFDSLGTDVGLVDIGTVVPDRSQYDVCGRHCKGSAGLIDYTIVAPSCECLTTFGRCSIREGKNSSSLVGRLLAKGLTIRESLVRERIGLSRWCSRSTAVDLAIFLSTVIVCPARIALIVVILKFSVGRIGRCYSCS